MALPSISMVHQTHSLLQSFGEGGPEPFRSAAIGPTEIIIIVAVLTLFFGAKRIPTIARGLGEGIRNFKGSLKEGEAGDDEERGP